MKFNIWQPNRERMLLNHTMQTVADLKIHESTNVYLFQSGYNDKKGKPIAEDTFISFVDTRSMMDEHDCGYYENLHLVNVVALVKFIGGMFAIVENVNGCRMPTKTLKEVMDTMNDVSVIGNRYENPQLFRFMGINRMSDE